jgi:small subunit ribosomal protein S15
MAGPSVIKARKDEIVQKFARSKGDTGSPEVQVALITDRITELNGHFKTNPKDHHSRRGLLALVGQRRKLLTYLRKTSALRYNEVLQALELRK